MECRGSNRGRLCLANVVFSFCPVSFKILVEEDGWAIVANVQTGGGCFLAKLGLLKQNSSRFPCCVCKYGEKNKSPDCTSEGRKLTVKRMEKQPLYFRCNISFARNDGCWLLDELYKLTVIGVSCCAVSPHSLFLSLPLHTHPTYTVCLSHKFLFLLLHRLLFIKCISLLWL